MSFAGIDGRLIITVWRCCTSGGSDGQLALGLFCGGNKRDSSHIPFPFDSSSAQQVFYWLASHRRGGTDWLADRFLPAREKRRENNKKLRLRLPNRTLKLGAHLEVDIIPLSNAEQDRPRLRFCHVSNKKTQFKFIDFLIDRFTFGRHQTFNSRSLWLGKVCYHPSSSSVN